MPATIDSAPAMTIGQPLEHARYSPNPHATTNAATIARFIARAEINPAATARVGPIRSGPSAPRSASNTSFAKFVPIWIAIAPPRAASAGPQAAGRAHAVPTATGTTAAGNVLS